jgi:hypothetical protein
VGIAKERARSFVIQSIGLGGSEGAGTSVAEAGAVEGMAIS